MEFLKAIFGEKALTFDEFTNAINGHNSDDANKDNQIKLANLNTGEYVSKGDFDGVSTDLTSKTAELEKANALIEDMKKASKGNEDMQGKITDYENQVTALQNELAETKLKSAVKVALLSENAADVDYLTFKLNEKLSADGKTLELDDNGNVKGLSDRISELKTAYPKMFDDGNGNGYTLINGGQHRLPEGDNRGSYTKSELLKLPYAERNRFYNENPEAYSKIMND